MSGKKNKGEAEKRITPTVELSPKPNNTKYDPLFCKDLIEHLGKGYSLASFPATIYQKYQILISRRIMDIWVNQHPEFAQAKELGLSLSLRYYETLLTYHVSGRIPEKTKEQQNRPMSQTMLIFTLKTRFWREYGNIQKQAKDE